MGHPIAEEGFMKQNHTRREIGKLVNIAHRRD